VRGSGAPHLAISTGREVLATLVSSRPRPTDSGTSWTVCLYEPTMTTTNATRISRARVVSNDRGGL